MEKKELELYLHIPFCVRKCAYCDFLSAPADEKTRREYVYTLIQEIQGYKETFYGQYHVSSVFIGGGTPSILKADQMEKIFAALDQSFQIAEDAEITIEVNPGTASKEKLLGWKKVGINRLSIGLQSTDDRELKMLGRIHTWQQFLETYRMAREQGFNNINIDLISAIPGQTVESWTRTLGQVAELNPEHISAYSLIIEEGTPFFERYGEEEENQRLTCSEEDMEESGQQSVNAEHNGESSGDMSADTEQNVESLPPLPDEETERTIYELTADLLLQYGYERYEISNYAKPGYACRHNLGYWDRKEYLGIGLGASSLIGSTRFHNTADYKNYIEKVQGQEDIREEIEELSKAEEAEEFMFLGLRETKGISVQKFQDAFGKPIAEVYGKQIEKLCQEGLLEEEGGYIRLTKHGIDVSNAVFVEFLEPEI